MSPPPASKTLSLLESLKPLAMPPPEKLFFYIAVQERKGNIMTKADWDEACVLSGGKFSAANFKGAFQSIRATAKTFLKEYEDAGGGKGEVAKAGNKRKAVVSGGGSDGGDDDDDEEKKKQQKQQQRPQKKAKKTSTAKYSPTSSAQNPWSSLSTPKSTPKKTPKKGKKAVVTNEADSPIGLSNEALGEDSDMDGSSLQWSRPTVEG